MPIRSTSLKNLVVILGQFSDFLLEQRTVLCGFVFFVGKLLFKLVQN